MPFLEVAARELTDRKIPVAELGRNALDLRHAAGRSPGEALAILENALLRRLPSVHLPDPMVARAIALLFKPSPHSIGALARELGRSRQHIGRMFLQHVGIGPKELARIARLQRAIAYLQRCPSQSLADAAARLGYFDQAHLARDFRLLAGATPRVVHAGAGSIFPIQSLFGDADFGA